MREFIEETLGEEGLKRGIRVGLDVFAAEPSGATGTFSDPIVALPNVYGTHHIGASTDQAQEAIAAETRPATMSPAMTGPNSRVMPRTSFLVIRSKSPASRRAART